VHFYRIPYKLHSKRAKTKASLAYGDNPRSAWLTFQAKSHAEARRMLQTLILPLDKRPILGRTYVRGYAIPVPDSAPDDRVADDLTRHLPADGDEDDANETFP